MTKRRPPTDLGDMTDEELAQWGVSKRPAPPAVVSGRIAVGSVGLAPGAPLSVFGGSFDRAVPRVLSLGVPVGSFNAGDAASRFPPHELEGGQPLSFQAGIRGDTFWNAGIQGSQFAAAVLTYGAGASSHRVTFDWRPGSYNLPPVEFVELSVIAYGSSWGTNPGYTFAASCSPGHLLDAHPPTVTGVSLLSVQAASEGFTPVDTATLGVPARARAVDIWMPEADGSVVGYQPRGEPLLRDYTGGVFVPAGPASVEPGTIDVQLVAAGLEVARMVGVKFFLAL